MPEQNTYASLPPSIATTIPRRKQGVLWPPRSTNSQRTSLVTSWEEEKRNEGGFLGQVELRKKFFDSPIKQRPKPLPRKRRSTLQEVTYTVNTTIALPQRPNLRKMRNTLTDFAFLEDVIKPPTEFASESPENTECSQLWNDFGIIFSKKEGTSDLDCSTGDKAAEHGMWDLINQYNNVSTGKNETYTESSESGKTLSRSSCIETFLNKKDTVNSSYRNGSFQKSMSQFRKEAVKHDSSENLITETLEVPSKSGKGSSVLKAVEAGRVDAIQCESSTRCPSPRSVMKVPRVVGFSIKSFKDIPKELFDSLPESSVDPIIPLDIERAVPNVGKALLSKEDEQRINGHMEQTFKNQRSPGPTKVLIKDDIVSTPRSKDSLTLNEELLLERELEAAGIYFRRPESSNFRRDTSNRMSRKDVLGDVQEALSVLDSSLADFSSSSGSSPDRRSHSSVAVEHQNVMTEGSDDRAFSHQPISSARGSVSQKDGTMIGTACRSVDQILGVGVTRQPEKGSTGNGFIHQSADNVTSDRGTAKITKDAGLERLNLIEEVYVDTKTIPVESEIPSVKIQSMPIDIKKKPTSSVHMKAYYPAVETMSTKVRNTQTGDSDSGHESGATSPCGTLTDDHTPPPTPPDSRMEISSQNLSFSVTPIVIHHSSKEDPGVSKHFVVVAIDFGTTFSGYAYSFTREPDKIYVMKKREGGDPGIHNQKIPTIVLLTPDKVFHSMGFTARDTFHDLSPKEAKKWLYFDKFKMVLHSQQALSRETLLEASNGELVPAMDIFSCALGYFRSLALQEIGEQVGMAVLDVDVCWVITVPAIWSHPAKQFMRMAAYQAGIGTPQRPTNLLIALEPEAAAIYCRRLRPHQLLPKEPPVIKNSKAFSLTTLSVSPSDKYQEEFVNTNGSSFLELDREEILNASFRNSQTVGDWLNEGMVYMVVDCGGGTVDMTVHQMTDRRSGHLKELHKATGGAHGSTDVDEQFINLLNRIFGTEFMSNFKQQRSAAYVDLMIAFESRKRTSSPYKDRALNIALPFSLIDLFKKTKGKDVESSIKKHSSLGVSWSSQGMLRVEPQAMRTLFEPTLYKISEAIECVLSTPEVGDMQYLFLVGGFAASEVLQKHIRDIFSNRVNVIIPQGMDLAILYGAVQFGLDPSVVTVRRSRLTYGVGVLNRFVPGVHLLEKRVIASGNVWCADVLDKFVCVDESVALGDVVSRSYTPATATQNSVILHLYATERHDAMYVTDAGVERVGTLRLDLQMLPKMNSEEKREITVYMKFGDTEIQTSAVDQLTGQCVNSSLDFLEL